MLIMTANNSGMELDLAGEGGYESASPRKCISGIIQYEKQSL